MELDISDRGERNWQARGPLRTADVDSGRRSYTGRLASERKNTWPACSRRVARRSTRAQSPGADLGDRVTAEHVAQGLFRGRVRSAEQHQTWQAGLAQHTDLGVVESFTLGDVCEFREQCRR